MEDITEKKANTKYVEKQKNDVRNTWVDINKARKMLNWNPKVDINYGIRKYIE